jgi:hypothetical protein
VRGRGRRPRSPPAGGKTTRPVLSQLPASPSTTCPSPGQIGSCAESELCIHVLRHRDGGPPRVRGTARRSSPPSPTAGTKEGATPSLVLFPPQRPPQLPRRRAPARQRQPRHRRRRARRRARTRSRRSPRAPPLRREEASRPVSGASPTTFPPPSAPAPKWSCTRAPARTPVPSAAAAGAQAALFAIPDCANQDLCDPINCTATKGGAPTAAAAGAPTSPEPCPTSSSSGGGEGGAAPSLPASPASSPASSSGGAARGGPCRGLATAFLAVVTAAGAAVMVVGAAPGGV